MTRANGLLKDHVRGRSTLSNITKDFKLYEFACPCCGRLNDDLKFRSFVARLQEARDIAMIPFRITSGYRCEAHNRKVGGVPDSAHLSGLAADISAVDSSSRMKILSSLILVGFRRIGIGRNFIHVDEDKTKVQGVCWLYGDA